jgi:predicted transcriptional regulator
MKTAMPTPETVRKQMEPLGYAEMRKLAAESGVPFTTLLKIKSGETENPGIRTVSMFWGHLPTSADQQQTEGTSA